MNELFVARIMRVKQIVWLFRIVFVGWCITHPLDIPLPAQVATELEVVFK